MSDFTIDPEFRDLLPPLLEDEFARLRDDINKHGCRDNLVVWREYGTLIDGHHRHDICTTLGLPFDITEMSFRSRDEVKMWLFRNQLGRRNLTDFQRAEIALRMKPVVATQAKERQTRKPADSVVENLPQQNEGQRTRDVVAEIAGVSGKTIDKVEQILEQGSPELVQQARTKEISIEKAHRIVTGKASPSATNAPSDPPPTARQEKSWLALKEEVFTRIRDYCRRSPAARGTVLSDLRQLIKSLER